MRKLTLLALFTVSLLGCRSSRYSYESYTLYVSSNPNYWGSSNVVSTTKGISNATILAKHVKKQFPKLNYVIIHGDYSTNAFGRLKLVDGPNTNVCEMIRQYTAEWYSIGV